MSEKPTARVAIRPAGNASPQQLDAQAKCVRSSEGRSDLTRCRSALLKLGAFTIAIFVLPIVTYFVSLEHYWGRPSCWSRAHADAFAAKNTTPAAISAAVMVNVVLVAYIIVAFLEDQPAAAPKTKAQ